MIDNILSVDFTERAMHGVNRHSSCRVFLPRTMTPVNQVRALNAILVRTIH